MKTKNIFLSSALSLALLFSGCDSIAEDDRFIDVEPAKVERTVLLEDFTGQNCVNCPAAHEVIESLEKMYGSHIVAVSIHAGFFAIPATSKRFTGLMQEEGQAYNDKYGITEYPSGIIDGQSQIIPPSQWPTAVYESVLRTTPLTIGLVANYDVEAAAIDIRCELTSTENLQGNLVVWVVESGIIARQEDVNKGRIPDYVHNNVFRACVNGLDGTPVSLVVRELQEKTFSIPVKDTPTEKWVPENLAIVAFVSTKSGVEQAAKVQVTTENQ